MYRESFLRLLPSVTEIPEVFSGLLLILNGLSKCVQVNGYSRPNRDDFDAAFTGPIDNSSSSYGQAPVAFKLLFSAFPQSGSSRMSASAARTLRFSWGCIRRMRLRISAGILRVRTGM